MAEFSAVFHFNPAQPPYNHDHFMQLKLMHDKTDTALALGDISGEIAKLPIAVNSFLIYDDHAHALHGGYGLNGEARHSFIKFACGVDKTLTEIKEKMVSLKVEHLKAVAELARETTERAGAGSTIVTADEAVAGSTGVTADEALELIKINGRDPGGVNVAMWRKLYDACEALSDLKDEMKLLWWTTEVEDKEEGGYTVKFETTQLGEVVVFEGERVRIRNLMVKIRDVCRGAFENPPF